MKSSGHTPQTPATLESAIESDIRTKIESEGGTRSNSTLFEPRVLDHVQF